MDESLYFDRLFNNKLDKEKILGVSSKKRSTPVSVGVLVLHSFALRLLLLGSDCAFSVEKYNVWLRITYSLPSSDWYSYEHPESKYLFDRPPLFAMLQYCLSHLLQWTNGLPADPSLQSSRMENEGVVALRLSTIFLEFVLIMAVIAYCNTWPDATTTEVAWSRSKVMVVTALVLFNPSLILLDYIHLGYFGLGAGALILSIGLIRWGTFRGDICSFFVYCSLLCFDASYMFVFPLFMVYFIRHFCFRPLPSVKLDEVGFIEKRVRRIRSTSVIDLSKGPFRVSLGRCIILSLTFLSAVSIPSGIFVGRHGLDYAYRVVYRVFIERQEIVDVRISLWSIYGLIIELVQLNFEVGIPDDLSSKLFPLIGMIFGTMSMLPGLKHVWKNPYPPVFLPAFIYCSLCVHMWAYTKNEDLIVLISMASTLTSCDSTMDAQLYLLISWIVHISLIPKLSTADVKLTLCVLVLLHCLVSYIVLDQFHIASRRARRIAAEPNGGGIFLSSRMKKYCQGLLLLFSVNELYSAGARFLFDGDFHSCPILERQSLCDGVAMTYSAAGLCCCWFLAFQQLQRKVMVVESYQASPSITSDRKRFWGDTMIDGVGKKIQ